MKTRQSDNMLLITAVENDRNEARRDGFEDAYTRKYKDKELAYIDEEKLPPDYQAMLDADPDFAKWLDKINSLPF